MKKAMLCGLCIGALALAGQVSGAVYEDNALNYADAPGWVDGSNGGTGFGAWEIIADGGAGWAGCGIWNSTNAGLNMGECFGYVGKVGHVTINRSFSQALNVGDSLEFDFGVNWDSDVGNKGFSLFAEGEEVINVNQGGTAPLNLNGEPAIVAYGTETMHWTFTQLAANEISVQATGRDGSETFATTVTTVRAYGYLGSMRFYSSGLPNNNEDERQSYFDNLKLTQEGTPPPAPVTLSFSAGIWNPATLGDYNFQLTRTGSSESQLIALSSDNEAAVTVPMSVWFDEDESTTDFAATVVSLTNGDATIIASNVLDGVWDTYTVRAPLISINGPWEIYAAGPVTYTLTRFAGIGNAIALASSDPAVLTVPATVSFAAEQTEVTFSATAIAEGEATITATAANGVKGEFTVMFNSPRLELNGPISVMAGNNGTYTVTRHGTIGDTVNLSSDDTDVMTVPATVTFGYEEDTVTFQANAVAAGTTVLRAGNDDATATPLTVTVNAAGNVIANDHAGNYTVETFVDGANEGFGFGVWDLWNEPATLGDSTEGGGGDLNSANGLSFKFASNNGGETNYCNARRNFDGALGEGDTVSFTFTYNWDGGNRGVDVFDSVEQFANLINVTVSNTFKVNGNVVSTEYSPGAVVEVEITQLSGSIAMSLVRTVAGVVNLSYTTNIVNALPATGFSMYCGGYQDTRPEAELDNYAIYMNDLRIVSSSEPVKSLTLSGPTKLWLDEEFAPEYTLTRSGDVADLVSLSSSDTGVMTVPATVTFSNGANTVTFMGTVVGAGITALTAENADATSASLGVVVAERPAYVLYDDASLYAGGAWADSPAHQTGFSDWTVVLTPEVTTPEEEIYRGVFIGSSPIEGMDEGGKSFGLYANYNGEVTPDPAPEVKVIRSFPELAVGQTFTVDVGYNWSSGTKGVKLLGTYDGNTYNRIELFNAGSDTWCYKLDDDDETIEVAWDGYIAGGFVGTMQVTCTAENTFTLTLQRARENAVIVGNILLPGGIDTVEFYNWNGGSGDEENFYFNRMGIIGEAAPSLVFIAGTWNPSALGDYEFTLRRTGSTGSEMIVLQSDNTDSVTVPLAVWFNDDEATVSFNATVVSLTDGDATILASNTITGVWAEYTVRPWQGGLLPSIDGFTYTAATGEMSFNVPAGYVLAGVEGADCQLVEGELIWLTLVPEVDYTYDAPEVTILTDAAARKMIRIRLALAMVGP